MKKAPCLIASRRVPITSTDKRKTKGVKAAADEAEDDQKGVEIELLPPSQVYSYFLSSLY